MVIDAENFFLILRTHHRFKPHQRSNDLLRLEAVAKGQLYDELTKRLLAKWLDKRRPKQLAQMS